jgi:serine phosphatase RsbU (regulator of sigma subunit)/HAMP domain-containing protein
VNLSGSAVKPRESVAGPAGIPARPAGSLFASAVAALRSAGGRAKGVRLGIRGKIAAVILLCMVPLLILGAVLYYERTQERRSLVLRTQQDTARGLAADIEMFMTNAVHAERAAGAAVLSQPYPVGGIVELFAAIRAQDPAFLSLALAMPDGRVEAADPSDDRRTSVDTRPAFASVRSGAEWAIGTPFPVDGHPGVEVATGIREHGRLLAVVDGLVDLSRLTAVFTTFARETDGIIVDGSGRVVLDLHRPDRPPDAFAQLPPLQKALSGQAVTIEGYRDPLAGTRQLGAAVPVPLLGWAVILLEPESSALEPVRRGATQELGWILAVAGLGLFLAWVLGSELSAPILALARGARAIGRGEIGHHVSTRRSDELGELGTAFNEMSAQLHRYVGEMNALQAVSDAALSTVRLRELLPTLVQQIVSALQGDGGTVWFADDTTGELAPTGFGAGAAGNTRRLRPGQGLAGRVAARGRPLAVSHPEALRILDPDLSAQDVRAAVSVPLRAGGKVIGVIQVFSRRTREFQPREVRLLETFADRVALAVDNARAYERQQEIAGIIQEVLLPAPSVRFPGLTIAGRYRPSRDVGGDFYAILPLGGGRVGLAIADVSGKGIPAATLSARARYLLEAFCLDGRAPDEVLERLNAVLTRDADTGMFVSLFYGVLDPEARTLRCANAGHLPPLLLRAGAPGAAPLEARGILLGVDPEARYPVVEMRVEPGDLLVLFTDGITEARNAAGEQFGDGQLAALLASLRHATPEDIVDRVMDFVTRWTSTGPADDQALVIASVLPPG